MRRFFLLTLLFLLMMPSTALAWICAPAPQTMVRAPVLVVGRVTAVPAANQVDLKVWAWVKGSGPRQVSTYFMGFPGDRPNPPQAKPEELAWFGIELPAPGDLVMMTLYHQDGHLVFGACHPFIYISPAVLAAGAGALAALGLAIRYRIKKRRQ